MAEDNPTAVLIPTRIHPNGNAVLSFLEKAGIKFLGTVLSSPSQYKVILPIKWKMVATKERGKSITYLVDNLDRLRGKIYSPYDTQILFPGTLVLLSRYRILKLTERHFAVRNVTFTAYDGYNDLLNDTENNDRIIFKTTASLTIHDLTNADGYTDRENKAFDQVVSWLDAKFPDWESPLAYWDT